MIVNIMTPRQITSNSVPSGPRDITSVPRPSNGSTQNLSRLQTSCPLAFLPFFLSFWGLLFVLSFSCSSSASTYFMASTVWSTSITTRVLYMTLNYCELHVILGVPLQSQNISCIACFDPNTSLRLSTKFSTLNPSPLSRTATRSSSIGPCVLMASLTIEFSLRSPPKIPSYS